MKRFKLHIRTILLSIPGFLFSVFSVQGSLWHIEELINHAERLEKLNSFQEAGKLYELALSESEEENADHPSLQDELRYRLALMHLFDHQEMQALKNLEENLSSPSYYLPLRGYLYKKLSRFEEAKEAFASYLKDSSDKKKEGLEPFAQWMLANLFFEEGDLQTTAYYLSPLLKDPSPYFHAAHLLLAKTQWLQGDPERALFSLNSLAEDASIHLLQAEIYSSLGNYALALEFYKKIDSKNEIQKREIKYRIAYLYFLQNQTSRAAQTSFEELLTLGDKRVILPLAELYLKQAERTNDLKLMRKSEELINRYLALNQIEPSLQMSAHIIRAKAIPLYEAREEVYRSLTSQAVLHHPSFLRAWMERGINDFNEASLSENTHKYELLAKSILNFETAELLDPSEIEAIIWKAKAYLAYQSPEKEEEAYYLLNETMERYSSQLVPPRDISGLHYLLSYTAYRSTLPERQGKAIDLWGSLVKKYPQSPYAPLALFSLGTHFYLNNEYEKAKEYFLQITQNYPNELPEASYFISLCEEKLGAPWTLLTTQRRAFWEKYSTSKYAVDAYYHTYPYTAYIKAEPEAILHLQQMSSLFPTSALSIHAYYLIGLAYLKTLGTEKAEPITAIDYFSKAQELYTSMKEAGHITKEELPYYTALDFQITLRKGWTYIAIAKQSVGAKRTIYLEYGADTFEALAEKETKESEEALFALGQIYTLNHQIVKAEEIFDRLIEQFQNHRITRGYYLSRTLFEKAMLSKERKEYAAAIVYFQQAEDAAQGKVLSAEQRIELWIEWGLAQMELGKNEEALWLLSRAVNDHVISELRLKAMFLRAEIYMRQERKELAMRQLVSLAKMEGEWAQKAKEKIELIRINHD